MKGQQPFQKGKGACEVALGSRVEGQPSDATTWQCVVAADSRSWVASGLTRGGR
jgi:hypothetical protein